MASPAAPPPTASTILPEEKTKKEIIVIQPKRRFEDRNITKIVDEESKMSESEMEYEEGSNEGSCEEAGYITPKRKRRAKKSQRKLSEQVSNVNVTNQFSVLQNAPENVPEQPPKKIKPPPTVVHGHFKKFQDLQQLLRENVKKPYTIRYTMDKTNLQFTTEEDRENFNRALIESKIEFHTYTPKDLKTYAYVIRGLDQEPEIEDLREELKKEEIETQNIYKMKGTRRPTYLIITTKEWKIEELNTRKHIILYIKVTWSRHYNNKEMVQCHRCQQWGHATSNCNARHRCLKCAENHPTNQCPKKKEEEPKCVNCGGAHVANNRECPSYLRRLEWIQKNRRIEEPKPAAPKYVPAPAPTTNAWNQRREERPQQPPATPPPSRPQTNQFPQASSSSPSSASNPTNCMNDLFAEFKRLNELCNVNCLLNAIRALNKLLANASSSQDKFLIFMDFTNNKLSAYGL